MMADLFWNVATSTTVLVLLAAIAVAAFLVAHVPALVERLVPQLLPYVVAAGLVQLIAASLLMFLIGFRISDERALTKQLKNDLAFSELQVEQQKATADDAERLKAEAEANANEAKGKLDDYRKKYGDRPETVCAFTADDLERLRALRRAK
jgi:hypothetical protein